MNFARTTVGNANITQMAYAASKFALETASEILAMEMQPFGVRVAMIEPGVVLTPIFEKNEAQPDLSSPYSKFYLRMGSIFAAGLKKPTIPQAVVETMQEAIESDNPKLRYLVGKDALSIMEARRTMSDEEWIGTGTLNEKEFRKFARDKMDPEL